MMFAVPGWSVPPEALIAQPTESTNPPPGVASKAGKKRKRSNGVSKGAEANSANLSELWQTVIEKKSDRKNSSRRKKREKKESYNAEKPVRNLAVSEGATGHKQTSEVKEKVEKLKGCDWTSKMSSISSNPMASDSVKNSNEPPATKSISLTPLQWSMRQKLVSARFRHLNQALYTTPSARSLALFQDNPQMFKEYHEGFRRQVRVWPENPLDGYLDQLRRRGAEQNGTRTKPQKPSNGGESKQGIAAIPLPRTDGTCYIADLGCGDADLSKGLEGVKQKLRLQVFSYDLQSSSPLVTQADIADLPLKDGSIHIAIFCLALMGTNWTDFIEEAYRILKWRGELWIAEIKSRFSRTPGQTRRVDHSVGQRKKSGDLQAKKIEAEVDNANLLIEVDGHEDNKGETNISAFVEVLRKRGFNLRDNSAVDLSNKMFVRLNFVKGQVPIKGKCAPVPERMVDTWKKRPMGLVLDEKEELLSSEAAVLKPCVYKLR